MTAHAPSTPRRLEIEGLRTVAALLVAIYHIWVGQVSGGVDVFFVVTGFFITLTLLKQLDTGRIRPVAYFGRLFRRLLPGAAVVLIAIGAITVWFAPIPLWRRNFEEILASSLSVENLYLAFNAIDYLNAKDPATPAQHFWAMSIQAQFYVLWLLVACLALVAVRAWAARPRRAMAVLVGVVFVVSLALSIWQTHTMQPFAYFVPWTRMWEFSIGAGLAILGSRLHLRGAWAGAVSWAALVVLFSTGALLPVEQGFPGVIAAVPALAAAGILVSTREGERWWAGTRILSWRPFAWLGSIAFGIYLWHWPLLMLYRYIVGLDARPGVFAGLAIIAASIVLAYLTNRVLERPVMKSWSLGRGGKAAVAVTLVTAWIAAVGIPVGTWAADRLGPPPDTPIAQEPWIEACSGLAALRTGVEECRDLMTSVALQPHRADVRGDIEGAYACYTRDDASELRECPPVGDPDGPRVAIMGNSHAAMLTPVLRRAAEERGWYFQELVGNGCIWTLESDGAGCGQRLQQQEETLLGDPFDVLILLGSANERLDDYPVDHVRERFREVIDAGTMLIVIEDNPRLSEEQATCLQEVSDHDLFTGACDMTETEGYSYRDGYWEVALEMDEVIAIPARDLYCVDGDCPIVIGGIIAYRDRVHITLTYVREIFPELLDRIDSRTDALITS